jgi:hypothetical protein
MFMFDLLKNKRIRQNNFNLIVFGLKLSLRPDKINAKRLEKKKQIFFSLAKSQEFFFQII